MMCLHAVPSRFVSSHLVSSQAVGKHQQSKLENAILICQQSGACACSSQSHVQHRSVPIPDEKSALVNDEYLPIILLITLTPAYTWYQLDDTVTPLVNFLGRKLRDRCHCPNGLLKLASAWAGLA